MQNKLWWVVLCVRIGITIFATGYIHPDEFFQSPSIVAHYLFPTNQILKHSQLAWEWDKQSSELASSFDIQRSIIFPLLINFLPLQLVHYFQESNYDSLFLYILPKLFVLSISILVEWYFCKQMHATNPMQLFLFLQLLWPIILFHGRTFSNTIEALLFALFLIQSYKTLEQGYQFSKLSFVVLGAIIGFGIFARFTFIIFSASIVPLLLLFKKSSTHLQLDCKTIIFKLCDMTIGFICAASVCIFVDTLFYYDFSLENFVQEATRNYSFNFIWITTPLNNFIYNLDTSNLAKHGIHPRYLHAVVNFPLLFGFLGVYAIQSLPRQFKIRSKDFSLILMSTLAIIGGMIGLSMAKHQEPRFLLPLSFPIALLLAKSNFLSLRKNTWFTFALIVVHLVGGILFFGFLHQAQIIPAMFRISTWNRQFISERRTYLFVKTYAPLNYLAVSKAHNASQLIIEDLRGISSEELLDHPLMKTFCSKQSHDTTFLVTPLPFYKEVQTQLPCTTNIVESLFPHVSTENMPDDWRDMKLVFVQRAPEK